MKSDAKGYEIIMSVIIETFFESAVTESNKDSYTGSFIEDGKTVIEFDMKKRDWRKTLKTDSEIFWYGEAYTVDVREFSTFHSPVIYRFAISRGYYLRADGGREYFTTEPSEVSTGVSHLLHKKYIDITGCFV